MALSSSAALVVRLREAMVAFAVVVECTRRVSKTCDTGWREPVVDSVG